MKTFSDNTGCVWSLSVNTAAVKRVRSLLGVNLLSVVEDGFKLLADLTSDFVLLVDVLYCIVKPEADAKNVSDEEFGRRMAGDCLGTAADALVEELVDFFPDPRKRQMLRGVVSKSQQVTAKALEAADKLLGAMDPEQLVKTAIGSASS